MAEKCPKCGAERDSRPKMPPRSYVCGTVWVGLPDNNINQSDKCRIRQLKARVSELESGLAEARDFLAVFVDSPAVTKALARIDKLLKGDG